MLTWRWPTMAVRMNSNSSAARDSEAAFSWRIIRPPRRTRYGSPRTEKPTSNVSCIRGLPHHCSQFLIFGAVFVQFPALYLTAMKFRWQPDAGAHLKRFFQNIGVSPLRDYDAPSSRRQDWNGHLRQQGSRDAAEDDLGPPRMAVGADHD